VESQHQGTHGDKREQPGSHRGQNGNEHLAGLLLTVPCLGPIFESDGCCGEPDPEVVGHPYAQPVKAQPVKAQPVKRALIHSEKDIAHELGYVGEWLDANGYEVVRVFRPESIEDESFPDADLLINLGSLSSAVEAFTTDATENEIAAVTDWIAAGKPYLGICFGAQVMARALGGNVERQPAVHRGFETLEQPKQLGPWIRWHEDFITDPGSGDIVSETEDAIMIFRSDNAWGVQPHLELTPETLTRFSHKIGVDPAESSQLVSELTVNSAAAKNSTFALLDHIITGPNN
jgi:GMP synthase (glutamine-hydrolysing)